MSVEPSPSCRPDMEPLVMAPGSTTSLDVDGTGTGIGAGNYDRAIVQGAGNTFTAGGQMVVRLRGITGSANNTYTPPVGQQFDVIHADGGVLASYAGLTEPTSGLATGTQFDSESHCLSTGRVHLLRMVDRRFQPQSRQRCRISV